MFLVGLTGGIATGKSYVAELFRRKGFEVIDADVLVHELLAPGGRAVAPVAAFFGPDVSDDSGGIDRSALAEAVFSSPEKRLELNEIIHPLVRVEMKARVSALDRIGYSGVTILDVPLLGDTLPAEGFDAVVVIISSRKSQVNRLMKHRRLTEEEAALRLAAQVPVSQKKRIADYVIQNNGSFDELESAVADVAAALERRAGETPGGGGELPW